MDQYTENEEERRKRDDEEQYLLSRRLETARVSNDNWLEEQKPELLSHDQFPLNRKLLRDLQPPAKTARVIEDIDYPELPVPLRLKDLHWQSILAKELSELFKALDDLSRQVKTDAKKKTFKYTHRCKDLEKAVEKTEQKIISVQLHIERLLDQTSAASIDKNCTMAAVQTPVQNDLPSNGNLSGRLPTIISPEALSQASADSILPDARIADLRNFIPDNNRLQLLERVETNAYNALSEIDDILRTISPLLEYLGLNANRSYLVRGERLNKIKGRLLLMSRYLKETRAEASKRKTSDAAGAAA